MPEPYRGVWQESDLSGMSSLSHIFEPTREEHPLPTPYITHDVRPLSGESSNGDIDMSENDSLHLHSLD